MTSRRRKYITAENSFPSVLAGMVALFWLCFWPACGLVEAQVNGQGTITGTVTDPKGAVIVGAKIVVTNTETAVAQTTTSNDTGYYRVANLNVGLYSVVASAPGFKSLARNGITVSAATESNVPVTLTTGVVEQTVVVNGDASLLETESPTTGQAISQLEVQELPMSGENPMWVAMMAPGVQTTLAQDVYRNGTLNDPFIGNYGTAGILNANEFSLDGAPNMGSNRSPAINPSADEVAELKVDVIAFDAAMGHSFGIQQTAVTKSGTNIIHGSVHEQYWNRRWAAMGHFQGLNYRYQQKIDNCTHGPGTSPQCFQDEVTLGWPGVHENNGGFDVGGPIYIPHLVNGRNKLFFFVSGLDDVFADVSSGSNTVPTVRQRSGDFSDLPIDFTTPPAAFTAACGTGTPYFGEYQIYNPYSTVLDSNGVPRRQPFCGNVIPSNLIGMSNPAIVTNLNKEVPTPLNHSVLGGNFPFVVFIPQTFHQWTTREDFAPSQSDHFFFRYTKADYSARTTTITTDKIDDYSGPRHINTGAVGWNHVFSPATDLNVTIGGTNFGSSPSLFPGFEKFTPTDLGFPSYLTEYAKAREQYPVQNIAGYQLSVFGTMGSSESFGPEYRNLAFRGTLSHVQGRHTLNVGAEYRVQNYSGGGPGNLSGTFTYDNTYTQENNGTDPTFSQSPSVGLPFAAFLMNVQTQSSVSYAPAASYNSPYWGAYIGDSWRLTPKPNLIPGIRYEFEYGPTEKRNRQIVGWDASASLPIASSAAAAYGAALANASPEQKAVLPPSITVQGGPVYAGANGSSNRQWVNSYRILPRIAFNYQINPTTVIRGGYGLFFDTLNALQGAINQDGFGASTTVPSSTVYGADFSTDAAPLADPFPKNAGGARFLTPVGNAAGAMYYAGASPTVYDHSRVPGRANRGQIAIQHQFGASTMMEVAWIGNIVTHLTVNQNMAPAPASLFGGGIQPNVAMNALMASKITNPFQLANFADLAATNPAAYSIVSLSSYYQQVQISIGNLEHAYPQMSGLALARSIGESKFNELQVNYRRTFASDLLLNGMFQINHQQDRDYFANPFDVRPSWEASNSSAPYRLTAEGVYNLPFGKGKKWAVSGMASALAGGFTLSATYELQPGNLVTFGNLFYLGDTNKVSLKKKRFVNNLENGGYDYVQWFNVGNVSETYSDGSCTYTGTGFVTNPSCQPNGYNLRAFPTHVKNVRQQGPNAINANMKRVFKIREGITFDARFEVYNLFNHEFFAAPEVSVTSPQFGQVTGDNGQGGNNRWVAIQGHLTF